MPNEHDKLNRCFIPLSPRTTNRKYKVIACHDMAGGYNDDRFIQGSQNTNTYRFQYWSLIDYFIYFSHSRLTIPPVNWTIAAHRNGVKVLGTFIAEGEDGSLDSVKLIYGPNSEKKDAFSTFYADMLIEMAEFYGFDGWFFNFEAAIDACHIPHLIQFLDYFTRRLHSKIPGSISLWYQLAL